MEIDEAVFNKLIAERDRLRNYVKDARTVLERCGRWLNEDGVLITGDQAIDLAARAEAILEDKR